MTELPDFNKITFPEMPPIPLECIVPDASPDVSRLLPVGLFLTCFLSGIRFTETFSSLCFVKENLSSRGKACSLFPQIHAPVMYLREQDL